MKISFLLVSLFLAGCASLPPSENLRMQVDEMIGACGGTWGIYFRDLQTGDTFAHNPDEVFHAASTMKVLVLMKLMRDIEDGRYHLHDLIPVHDQFPSAIEGAPEFKVAPATKIMKDAIGREMKIARLIEHMIVRSDNLATNVLIRQAGGALSVSRHAQTYGFQKTTVARYIEDIAAYDAGLSSHAAAGEFGMVLEKMFRGEVISENASQQILKFMSRLSPRWLGKRLPEGTRVAHKTGYIEQTRHDVGIIRGKDNRAFVLAILSHELPDEKKGEQTIETLARLFYDHVMN